MKLYNELNKLNEGLKEINKQNNDAMNTLQSLINELNEQIERIRKEANIK